MKTALHSLVRKCGAVFLILHVDALRIDDRKPMDAPPPFGASLPASSSFTGDSDGIRSRVIRDIHSCALRAISFRHPLFTRCRNLGFDQVVECQREIDQHRVSILCLRIDRHNARGNGQKIVRIVGEFVSVTNDVRRTRLLRERASLREL